MSECPAWANWALVFFFETDSLWNKSTNFTHHIAPDVDTERDHVFTTLEETHELMDTYQVNDFQKVLQGKNGGGDSWHTDGDLWVGVIAVQERKDIEGLRQPDERTPRVVSFNHSPFFQGLS